LGAYRTLTRRQEVKALQTRVAIVGVSLGAVLFAAVSDIGRWVALLAGCTVLTWLVAFCVGRKPAYVFLPAAYGFAFALAFGLVEQWPGTGTVTAGAALAGLAAGGALVARSLIQADV
jgi:hypothetical protein